MSSDQGMLRQGEKGAYLGGPRPRVAPVHRTRRLAGPNSREKFRDGLTRAGVARGVYYPKLMRDYLAMWPTFGDRG